MTDAPQLPAVRPAHRFDGGLEIAQPAGQVAEFDMVDRPLDRTAARMAEHQDELRTGDLGRIFEAAQHALVRIVAGDPDVAAVGAGLAAASTGVGTFIAYATQPGNVALDGKGRNSPFSTALLANMAAQGRNLNATMIEVRKAVIAATGGKQVPWDHSALTGDFYFVPGDVPTGRQTAAPA